MKLEQLQTNAAIRGIAPDALELTYKTHYLPQPFIREPDFGVTSVNYDFADLISKAGVPT